MDLQTIILSMVNNSRQEEVRKLDVLTLGELVAKLEGFTTEQLDLPIRFDNTDYYPTTLGSWRGVYSEMYVGYIQDEVNGYNSDEIEWESEDGEHREYVRVGIEMRKPTASEFLRRIKESIGKQFTGYKGGDFTMNRHTPLWVSSYGKSNGFKIGEKGWENQSIVGVVLHDDYIELQTKIESN